MTPGFICAGAAHWDIIGRTAEALPPGADVPGTVLRRPGGVALNVAFALAALGCRTALLAALGRDPAGDELAARITAAGIDPSGLHRHAGRTDAYVAIEDGCGELRAAVADCAGLESAGRAVLAPLRDGRLALPGAGPIVADGNLPLPVLTELLDAAIAAGAAVSLVPASPGKAALLAPLCTGRPFALYLNRIEAERLCRASFRDSRVAAIALRGRGIADAIVTDGGAPATAAVGDVVVTLDPRRAGIRSVTGAGDAFVAAHLAARERGLDVEPALAAALEAAARHIEVLPP